MTPNQLRLQNILEQHKRKRTLNDNASHSQQKTVSFASPGSNSFTASPLFSPTGPRQQLSTSPQYNSTYIAHHPPSAAEAQLLHADSWSQAYRHGYHPLQAHVDASIHRQQWFTRENNHTYVPHIASANTVSNAASQTAFPTASSHSTSPPTLTHPPLLLSAPDTAAAVASALASAERMYKRHPGLFAACVGTNEPLPASTPLELIPPDLLHKHITFLLEAADADARAGLIGDGSERYLPIGYGGVSGPHAETGDLLAALAAAKARLQAAYDHADPVPHTPMPARTAPVPVPQPVVPSDALSLFIRALDPARTHAPAHVHAQQRAVHAALQTQRAPGAAAAVASAAASPQAWEARVAAPLAAPYTHTRAYGFPASCDAASHLPSGGTGADPAASPSYRSAPCSPSPQTASHTCHHTHTYNHAPALPFAVQHHFSPAPAPRAAVSGYPYDAFAHTHSPYPSCADARCTDPHCRGALATSLDPLPACTCARGEAAVVASPGVPQDHCCSPHDMAQPYGATPHAHAHPYSHPYPYPHGSTCVSHMSPSHTHPYGAPPHPHHPHHHQQYQPGVPHASPHPAPHAYGGAAVAPGDTALDRALAALTTAVNAAPTPTDTGANVTAGTGTGAGVAPLVSPATSANAWPPGSQLHQMHVDAARAYLHAAQAEATLAPPAAPAPSTSVTPSAARVSGSMGTVTAPTTASASTASARAAADVATRQQCASPAPADEADVAAYFRAQRPEQPREGPHARNHLDQEFDVMYEAWEGRKAGEVTHEGKESASADTGAGISSTTRNSSATVTATSTAAERGHAHRTSGRSTSRGASTTRRRGLPGTTTADAATSSSAPAASPPRSARRAGARGRAIGWHALDDNTVRSALALSSLAAKLPHRTRTRIAELARAQTLLQQRESVRARKVKALRSAYAEVVRLSKEEGVDVSVAAYVLRQLQLRIATQSQRQEQEEKTVTQKMLLEYERQMHGEARVYEALRKRHQRELANRGLGIGAVPGQGGASFSTNKALREEEDRVRLQRTLAKLRSDTAQFQARRRQRLEDISHDDAVRFASLAMLRDKDLPIAIANSQRRDALVARAHAGGDRLADGAAQSGAETSKLHEKLYGRDTAVVGQLMWLQGREQAVDERTVPISTKQATMYAHAHPRAHATSLELPPSRQHGPRWSDSTILFVEPRTVPAPFPQSPATSAAARPAAPGFERKTTRMPGYMQPKRSAASAGAATPVGKSSTSSHLPQTRHEVIAAACRGVTSAGVKTVRPELDSVLTPASPHYYKNMYKR